MRALALGRKAQARDVLESGLPVFSRYGLAHPDDVAAGRRALELARASSR